MAVQVQAGRYSAPRTEGCAATDTPIHRGSRVPLVLSRVTVRTGAALWRNRVGWLLGVAVVAGMLVYQGLVSNSRSVAAAGADCADRTMAAVASGSAPAARAAYPCLGAAYASVDEAQFVQQVNQRGVAAGQSATRVGEYRGADGGRVVFYVVSARGQDVGYIVYLDSSGKVAKIE